MSCNQPDCKDPTNYDSTDLSVNQRPQGTLDTCSCSINALLFSIAEQISALIGSSINIDVNKFIECSQSWRGAEHDGLPDKFRTTIETCLRQAGYTKDQINTIVKNIDKFIKIQSWLFRRGSKRYELKEKVISLPIKCDDSMQVYDEDVQYDCSKECNIQATLTFRSDSSAALNNIPMNNLPQALCQTGPIICNFSGEAFANFWKKARSSSDISDAFLEWDGTPFNTPIANPACEFSHTVTMVGYECEPQDNPTHYIFKFKDSFEYGSGQNTRPGYFYIKIPIGNLSQRPPWNIGDNYWFGGNFRIFGVTVKLRESIDNIKDLLKKCCPTPTPTPSATPTRTPTPTPSASYIIGVSNTPSETPHTTPTETPTETP